MLNAEQLKFISGGTIGEYFSDFIFLTNLGLLTDGTPCSEDDIVREFAKCGIKYVPHHLINSKGSLNNTLNEYYYNGKQISRDSALEIVATA